MDKNIGIHAEELMTDRERKLPEQALDVFGGKEPSAQGKKVYLPDVGRLGDVAWEPFAEGKGENATVIASFIAASPVYIRFFLDEVDRLRKRLDSVGTR